MRFKETDDLASGPLMMMTVMMMVMKMMMAMMRYRRQCREQRCCDDNEDDDDDDCCCVWFIVHCSGRLASRRRTKHLMDCQLSKQHTRLRDGVPQKFSCIRNRNHPPATSHTLSPLPPPQRERLPRPLLFLNRLPLPPPLILRLVLLLLLLIGRLLLS